MANDAKAINDRLFGGSQIDPEAATRGFELGTKAGAFSAQTGPAAFFNQVIDSVDKRRALDAQMAQEQQKARAAKIQQIILEGSLPNAHPKVKSMADQLMQQMNGYKDETTGQDVPANPYLAQLLGIDPSKGGLTQIPSGFQPTKFTSNGVTYESETEGMGKRGDKAREIDFSLAAKANEEMAIIEESISSLDTLFKKAVPDPSKSGTEAVFGGIGKNFMASIGANEDLRAFNDIKNSMGSLFSKGLFKEAGVLTNQDIQRALASLPAATDSATTLKAKLTNLKKIVGTARKNYELKRESFIQGTDFTPTDSQGGSETATSVGKFTAKNGKQYERFSDGSVQWL